MPMVATVSFTIACSRTFFNRVVSAVGAPGDAGTQPVAGVEAPAHHSAHTGVRSHSAACNQHHVGLYHDHNNPRPACCDNAAVNIPVQD
jgi:hypothetical protein